MASKRKFNTVFGGDTITINTKKQKHSVTYRNDKFLTYKAKNGRGVEVVAILLAEGLEADIGNLPEVAGDYVLNSRGFVRDGARVYLIKENYAMNLPELRVYFQRSSGAMVPPLTSQNKLPNLSETDNSALMSQSVTTFVTDLGDLSTLGRKVARDVNASLVTYTQAGFRITDLSEHTIAVKLMNDSTIIRFKLIVPLVDVTDDDASIREGYVKFLRDLLSLGANQRSSPTLTDLLDMLTSPDPNAPLDFILERQCQDFETYPGTVISHSYQWYGEKVMIYFHLLNNVFEMCHGYGNYSRHRLAVKRFLKDMGSINLEGGVYMQNGMNMIQGKNWSQIIHARSTDVWNIIDNNWYPPHQHTSPLHLVRLVRNKYEHIKDTPPLAMAFFGDSADTYWYFFNNLFPHLLIESYRVLQKHYYTLRPHYGNNPHFVSIKQYIGWDKF